METIQPYLLYCYISGYIAPIPMKFVENVEKPKNYTERNAWSRSS